MSSSNARVLVLLADGAEEMEVTIVVDVLRRAGVEVILAGVDGDGPVTCSRGVRVVPDCGMAGVEGPLDMLVLPGGLGGTERLCASEEVGAVLRAHEGGGRLLGAICAAPMALAKHGVYAGRALTSHPSVRDAVEEHGDYREDDVVIDRGLITSRGPGTAFAFALTLVARLAGDDVAAQVRAPMMLD